MPPISSVVGNRPRTLPSDGALVRWAWRLALGKPVEGQIRCKVSGGEAGLDIVIEDDGCGVARDLLEQKLTAAGMTAADAARIPLEALMFREGLSSRDTADEISGRGVGLSAVKAELDGLGGSVSVKTARDAGTRFHFHLPVRPSGRDQAPLEMTA